jgi:hypothetical protein
MNLEQFDKLVNEGRNLLTRRDHVSEIHDDFNDWFDNVANWLQENFPNSAFSADWSSLGVSYLVRQGGYDNSTYATTLFQQMVQTRLKWLSNLMVAFQNTRSTQAKKAGNLVISKKSSLFMEETTK